MLFGNPDDEMALLLARVGATTCTQPHHSVCDPCKAVFHILPTLVQGRLSPGIYTAALLYVPFSSWALIGAARDGVARTAIATAFAAGTLMIASVVLGARSLSNASYGG